MIFKKIIFFIFSSNDRWCPIGHPPYLYFCHLHPRLLMSAHFIAAHLKEFHMSITALLSIFSSPAFADNGTLEVVSSSQTLTDSPPHKSASRVDLSKDKTVFRVKVRHGFQMGYGYVNAPEDHRLIKSIGCIFLAMN